MEAQGAGVHIVMSAKTALELGCPVRGILAFTSTSTDKAGRSVPAPGRGVLTIAKEVPSKHPQAILNIEYRRRQLKFRRTQISQWLSNEQEQLREEIEAAKAEGTPLDEDYISTRISTMESEAKKQEGDALGMYGMLDGHDATIAPLRRALAVWGMSVDDIGVLSIHGTSTKANVRFPFLLCAFLEIYTPPGGERDPHLEHDLQEPWSYPRKCRSHHGAEEPPRSRQGRSCCVADVWCSRYPQHCHCTGQPKQRVS